MDKFVNLSKEKDMVKNYNKKMFEHLQDVKKKGEHTQLNHDEQKEEYQKKFEELMKKLEEDYNYDENKCKLALEENQRYGGELLSDSKLRLRRFRQISRA